MYKANKQHLYFAKAVLRIDYYLQRHLKLTPLCACVVCYVWETI